VYRVLFVCVHNSARSQMAQTYLNHLGNKMFSASSAGISFAPLNPNVVQVMKEDGFDISSNQPKKAVDLFRAGQDFDVVIAVCDRTAAEQCPVFPSQHLRLHWDLRDPGGFTGSQDEILAKTREIRDEIKRRVEALILAFGE